MNHIYALDGTKILCEAWGDNTIIPLYDNEDSVCGILYNDEPFYFQKNLQGDIIAIVDKDAHSVAKYSYDAWGVCTVVSDTSDCAIATVNPYRYRGYYYDNEIGMYYLQSRYYNPVVGRFVNGDSVEILKISLGSLFGTNLYAYTANSPVNDKDDSGDVLANIISGVIGALVNVLLDYLITALDYWTRSNCSFRGFKYNLLSWNTALVAASGFAAGLIIASKYKRWICMIGSAVISGITNVVSCVINKRKFNWGDLLIDIGFGLVWGYFGGQGVGNSLWKKDLFGKGGTFFCRGTLFQSSRSLILTKPIVKRFVKSFSVYVYTQICDWFQKFIRGKT